MLINLNESLCRFELIPGKRNHLNTNINLIIARDYTRTLCCFVSRHWFCAYAVFENPVIIVEDPSR